MVKNSHLIMIALSSVQFSMLNEETKRKNVLRGGSRKETTVINECICSPTSIVKLLCDDASDDASMQIVTA